MFKRLASFSLVFLMSVSQAASLSVDDGCKLSAGTIAGLVCIMSAPSTVRKCTSINKDNKLSANLYNALVAAGMGYSISKLAPYARKSLQLKSAKIATEFKSKAEARYISLIKGVLAGAVAGVTATEMINSFNHQQMKNNTYINERTGSILNLAYAAYMSGHYSYSKLKTVFK